MEIRPLETERAAAATPLPSKPQSTLREGASQRYRYSFYRVPWMKDGIDIPVPTVLDYDLVPLDLEKFLVYEKITDEQFMQGQSRLILTTSAALNTVYELDKIAAANYVRIALTTADEEASVANYALDSSPLYAWIDSAEVVGGQAIYVESNRQSDIKKASVVFNISPDFVLNTLFAHFTRIDDRNVKPKFVGRVVQTSLADYATDIRARSVITPTYGAWSGRERKYIKAETTGVADFGLFCIVGVYTTAEGDVKMFGVGAGGGEGLSLEQLAIQLKWFASATTFVATELDPSPTNLNVVKIYALPRAWGMGIFSAETVGLINFPQVQIGGGVYNKVEVYGVEYVDYFNTKSEYRLEYYSPTVPANVFSRVYLRTPSRLIQIEGNPRAQNASGIELTITAPTHAHDKYNVPQIGTMSSDTLGITLQVNGELIDISSDFEVDFAVNEQAVLQIQQKEITTLKDIKTAIASVGGAVGSAAAGNWFGVAQGAFNLATIGEDRRAQRERPAQMRVGGSPLNDLEIYGLLGYYIYDEPQNIADIKDYESKYGWLIEGGKNDTILPYEEFDYATANRTGFYLRMEQPITVSGLQKGGQNDMQAIIQLLERGARFVPISAF